MQRTSVDVLAEAKHSNLAKRSCGILQGVHHDRKTRLHVQDHRVFGLSILLLACHGLVDLASSAQASTKHEASPSPLPLCRNHALRPVPAGPPTC